MANKNKKKNIQATYQKKPTTQYFHKKLSALNSTNSQLIKNTSKRLMTHLDRLNTKLDKQQYWIWWMRIIIFLVWAFSNIFLTMCIVQGWLTAADAKATIIADNAAVLLFYQTYMTSASKTMEKDTRQRDSIVSTLEAIIDQASQTSSVEADIIVKALAKKAAKESVN